MQDSGAVDASPKQVEQCRAGNDKVVGRLVGQVMKATQGKANPQTVNQILRAKLGDKAATTEGDHRLQTADLDDVSASAQD